MQAIILVGGLGTRLRPLTDNTPKPLLPVRGRPTMQYAIENLLAHGIKDITLAVSYHADKIREYFKDGAALGANLTYSVESEPLGTGGAVKQAAQNLADEFVLIWGDNLMNVDITELVKVHAANPGLITMTLTPREDVEHFGVALLEGDKIIGFVEKPKKEEAPGNLINAGAFVLRKKALDILPDGVSSIERQCFEALAGQGMVYAYHHKEQWFPTDTLEKYRLAERLFMPL
ncbi:nucleotidyltransferase family protein [Patescibacteria group bacterium]|nr:MAG: nucleotidyltransferase family protein [Patescibacteria group bacterium]